MMKNSINPFGHLKIKRSIYKIGVILLVLLNIGCDQWSKSVVRKQVPHQEYIQLISDKLILTNVENTGAMLGFGQDFPNFVKVLLFQLLPMLVLLALLYRTLVKKQMPPLLVLAFAFVIGGGIGNLLDRIRYGSVTDFFQVRLGIFKTGIFNMADVSVTIGILLLLWISFSRNTEKN